jgi:hypothetical protein
VDEKAKPILKFSMKISHLSGCKAFSVQITNEFRNIQLHHNAFYCQPNISSKMKKNIGDKHYGIGGLLLELISRK